MEVAEEAVITRVTALDRVPFPKGTVVDGRFTGQFEEPNKFSGIAFGDGPLVLVFDDQGQLDSVAYGGAKELQASSFDIHIREVDPKEADDNLAEEVVAANVLADADSQWIRVSRMNGTPMVFGSVPPSADNRTVRELVQSSKALIQE